MIEWIEAIPVKGSKIESWVGLVGEKVVHRIERLKEGEYRVIERGTDVIPFLGRIDTVLHTAETLEDAKAFCQA